MDADNPRAEAPERPPTGDIVEIPGSPPETEYEIVRSPPPWLTPLAIGMVTLFAVFVVTRAATMGDADTIALSAAPEGAIPTALADGSPLPEVPEEITGRFAAPVVGTAPVSDLPEGLDEICAQPFSVDQVDQAAVERIDAVLSDGDIVDQRLGPDALTVLRVGEADSPPDWPRAWFLSCLGRYDDGDWAARAPRLDFARSGDRGATDDQPGVAARPVKVPPEATWAVQERDGWWLAAPVEPDGWVQLMVPLDRSRAPLRVVFLNDGGNVLADEVVTIPTSLPGQTDDDADGAPAGDRTLDVGGVDQILSAVTEGPVRRCADNLNVCVWITLVGSELQAHAAHGTHALDVPPFGELGWCPGSNRFQGTLTRSQFLPDGSWRAGVAPRNADAFPLRFSSGRVVVDLGERLIGEQATGEPRPSTICVFSGEPVGEEAEDQDAVEIL